MMEAMFKTADPAAICGNAAASRAAGAVTFAWYIRAVQGGVHGVMRRLAHDARVVHQHVDPPEGRDDHAHQFGRLLRIRQVTAHRQAAGMLDGKTLPAGLSEK